MTAAFAGRKCTLAKCNRTDMQSAKIRRALTVVDQPDSILVGFVLVSTKPGMDELARIQAVYRERMERDHADRYSLFAPGELYIVQRREEITLKLLARSGVVTLRNKTILEVGCGRGQRMAELQRWGAEPNRIHGIELFEPFVQSCAQAYSEFNLLRGSAHQLPYPDKMFDIALANVRVK